MSAAAKSPAELIADLTDQVRLLRQDVGNLTATATTKAEAARLRASVQKITIDALEQNRQIASTAAENSGLEEVITDLDQNPDFYVWLASGDADLLAME